MSSSRANRSLVAAAMGLAAGLLTSHAGATTFTPPAPVQFDGRFYQVVIANRTQANGVRLATSLKSEGVPATAVDLSQLPGELDLADIVFACTGSVDTVVRADMISARTRPLVMCDLGLPKD